MKRKWFRYGMLLASAAMLFQASSCAVDPSVVAAAVTPAVATYLTNALTGAYCPPT